MATIDSRKMAVAPRTSRRDMPGRRALWWRRMLSVPGGLAADGHGPGHGPGPDDHRGAVLVVFLEHHLDVVAAPAIRVKDDHGGPLAGGRKVVRDVELDAAGEFPLLGVRR